MNEEKDVSKEIKKYKNIIAKLEIERKKNKKLETNDKKPIYKFPEINASKEIAKYKKTLSDLDKKKKIISKINVKDVSSSGIFDAKAFNKKVDSINEITMQKKNIKDKIKLLNLKYKPIDYNKMTINELKIGLLTDTNEMLNELSLMKKFNYIQFNDIISKNYRKLTILILLLILFVISYYFYNFLSN